MASPQLENGYTKIAHEIIEHLVTVKMSGTEWQYVMSIIRKTYGWGKKEDWVTNSQIVEMTGLKKERVSEAKGRLIARNIVTENRNKISIQKDWEKWRELRKSVTKITEKRNSLLRKSVHTIDTNTKDNSPLNAELTNNKMYTYHSIDESGNPIRKRSSGRGKEIKARNAEYTQIGFLFEKLGEKSTGVKPDLSKSYFIIKNAREKQGVQDFSELFEHFFANQKLSPEQKVSLAFCCSPAYITQWKVSKQNKIVSQVEASADIAL